MKNTINTGENGSNLPTCNDKVQLRGGVKIVQKFVPVCPKITIQSEITKEIKVIKQIFKGIFYHFFLCNFVLEDSRRCNALGQLRLFFFIKGLPKKRNTSV